MTNNLFLLSQQLGKLCLQRNVHIALAESCTGGYLSAVITDVPGSSQWFCGGAVAYSNLAKQTILQVNESLIDQYGAVSESVAKSMAEGALQQFHAELAMSITGIAGPGGGTAEKPVGTVCFALADKKQIVSKTMQFTSGRTHIRHSASLFALEWMMMHLSIQ